MYQSILWNGASKRCVAPNIYIIVWGIFETINVLSDNSAPVHELDWSNQENLRKIVADPRGGLRRAHRESTRISATEGDARKTSRPAVDDEEVPIEITFTIVTGGLRLTFSDSGRIPLQYLRYRHAKRPAEGLAREGPGCAVCHSSMRVRALIALLSEELLGIPMSLVELPVLKGIRGIGMSRFSGARQRSWR